MIATALAIAPVHNHPSFMANHVVGVEMRHFRFAEGTAVLAWLRSP
jgi:hypothetical protein